MRNMKGEVVLNIPAEKAWKMYRDNGIISQINPEMLASAEYVEADGIPGSLRLLKLGPALFSYVKKSTEKTKKVKSGRSVAYRVIDGDLHNVYDPYRVTFTFTPVEGEEEAPSLLWKVRRKPTVLPSGESLEPLNPATPPEKVRDAALGFLKSFEKFQLVY